MIVSHIAVNVVWFPGSEKLHGLAFELAVQLGTDFIAHYLYLSN
jgi:hypothetical protein